MCEILPITTNFIAEIGDIDLSRPLDDECVEWIRKALWEYAVLIFPDQNLSVEQHLSFARNFGDLETTAAQKHPANQQRLPAEIADVSNLDSDNEIWGEHSRRRLHELANRLWHTDSSFKKVPALASFLYARSIPVVGGHTQFADERAAYDALPESRKLALQNLMAEHCIRYSRARIGFSNFSSEESESLPPVCQPLVRTIPQTGRKTLYLASHAGRIPGMPDDEAAQLIDQLITHASQRQYVHTHRWRVNDLVIWDNRCTMHRGTEYNDLQCRRDFQRATVSDVGVRT